MNTGLLEREYGVSISSSREVQGGWSARAFVLETGGGSRFLKQYDRHRPTAAPWIARIEHYAPAMRALWELPGLHTRLPELLPTLADGYMARDVDSVYLLFNYIDGPTLGWETALDNALAEQLGEIVGTLHGIPQPYPFPVDGLAEDLSLPFGEKLLEAVERAEEMPQSLSPLLRGYRHALTQGVEELYSLRAAVRVPCRYVVPCHTDIHGGNIMLDENGSVILLDWEGLCIAPPEADLFDLGGEPWFPAFRKGYSRAAGDRVPDPALIRYYKLRRRLEDIWEFIAQLLWDDPDRETAEKALHYLERDLRWLEK